MYNIKIIFMATLLCSIVTARKDIDLKYLKCLVCRATIDEIDNKISKIDPTIEVEVGNFRMDAYGNSIQNKVPLSRSEVHISDLLDDICEKMTDYVRATEKSSGKLTILNLMDPSGGLNPRMSEVDLIQDEDLNKSLQYYCEGIVEEFEEFIISIFTKAESNKKEKLCTDISNICKPTDFLEVPTVKEEL